MEFIKATEDMQFTVHYADGETRRVREGVLFEEGEDGRVIVYLGTNNRVNMLIAIFETVGEILGIDDDRK